MYVVIDT